MLNFAKIDVKEIECNSNRSSFNSEDIENLADLILDSNGILQPLILKQTGVEKYSIIDGYLEYFAAVRAREKDPEKGEMVHAFLIDAKDEASVYEQIKILRGPSQTLLTLTDSGNLDNNWISSFETRLSEMREVFFQTKRDHEYRFTKIEREANDSDQLDLLELINTLDKTELLAELSRYGLAKSKIELIFDSRQIRNGEKFESYQDVVNSTKNFGPSGMLNLIDSWNRFNRKR